VAWASLTGILLVLLVVPRTHDRLTTYATASPQLADADLAATVFLAAACLVGLVLQPARPGVAAVGLAGLAWTLPNLVGWQDGPDLVTSLGMVLTPMLVPLLVHVVLAASGRTWQWRWALVTLYFAAAVVGLLRALWYVPYLDASCFQSCYATNTFLVDGRPDLVRPVESCWLLTSATAGIGLGVGAVAWFSEATSAGRRMRGPGLVAGLALGVFLVVQSAVRWRRPHVDPTTSLDARLYLALVIVVALVAAAWAYGPLLDRGTRRGVARLVTGLGGAAAAGTVTRVLATATGDHGLRLVYRLPSSGTYADASGWPLDPPASGPGVTPVMREGQELAVVLHDPDVADARSVRAACGPALLLALDNERLEAEGRAQLAELTASRGRVVAAGDAERRALERNLHDGAQQRLLALSFDLRRAVTSAGGTPSQREGLARAEHEARVALAELRELAHGIHPAVLEEGGLEPALATLAERAPVPVEVLHVPSRRLPAGVEQTAYVVVRDALEAGASAGSEAVSVSVTVMQNDLVVAVTGAGPGPFVSIEDRVAGAGGHVETTGDRVQAVIPCGS
jgi:signal transduction histidine kinase